MICTRKKNGHNVETCFEIHVYPDWWGERPRVDGKGTAYGRGSSNGRGRGRGGRSDGYLKPWIIPDPEVTFTPQAKEDECLVLASDGLWDVMSNEEVCEIARKRILIWHKKNGGNLTNRGTENEVDPAAQAAAEYLVMRGSRVSCNACFTKRK